MSNLVFIVEQNLIGISPVKQTNRNTVISIGAHLTLGGKTFLPENVCMKN